MKRIYYKNKTFKDVEDNQVWEYANDPDLERMEDAPLEPLQSIFDILYSPYLEDGEKIEQAISKTKEISIVIKENLGRFLRKAHINCSHDMETAKGFVALLKIFNMY
jgi:hypothetical protein